MILTEQNNFGNVTKSFFSYETLDECRVDDAGRADFIKKGERYVFKHGEDSIIVYVKPKGEYMVESIQCKNNY